MLYIVPKNEPSEQPIIDELTMKMVAAFRKATLSQIQSYGSHYCLCGARCDGTDWILPNGTGTNSLCVHYLAYHRARLRPGNSGRSIGSPTGSSTRITMSFMGGTCRCTRSMGAGSGLLRRSPDVASGTTRDSETCPSRAVSPGCCGGLAPAYAGRGEEAAAAETEVLG